MISQRLKNILRKTAKVIVWTVVSVLILLIGLIIAIRIPAVQNKIVQAAVSFVGDKIGTPVRIKSIVLSFPKKVVISDLYVEDQSKDTLLFASELAVDIDMWALLSNTVEVNDFELRGANAKLKRSEKDSSYNFDYIIKAFSGSPTEHPDTVESKPWKINVESIELSTVSFLYNDRLARDSVNAKIGGIKIGIDEFNLDDLIFKIASVDFRNSRIDIRQAPVESKISIQNNSDSSRLPEIGIEEIYLEKIDLFYDETTTNKNLELLLGELQIDANEIDINRQMIDLKEIKLKETSIVYQQASLDSKPDNTIRQSGEFTDLGVPWRVKVENLEFAGNTFQFDNANSPVREQILDFNHLLISFLNIRAKDISLDKSQASINVLNTSFHERSGFSIEKFSSELSLKGNEMKISDLILRTGHSNIEMNALATYRSLNELASSPENSTIKLDVKNTFISLKDARFFVPEVIDRMAIYLPSSINLKLETSLRGSIRDLDIKRFTVSAFDSTGFSFHGKLKGLPQIKSTRVDAVIDKFYTTSYDVKLFLPDSLLPDSIRLPKWVKLNGGLKGTLTAPDVDLTIKSDVGNINVDGAFDFNAIPKYDAELELAALNLGSLLRQEESMGLLDLKAKVKGSGTKMKDLDTELDLVVKRFEYNKYEYQNLTVTGKVQKYFFEGKAAIKDENLDLELNGNLNYNDSIPEYNLKVILANADFNALHFSETPLKARTTVDINLNTNDFKMINGNMDVRKFAIFNGKKIYTIDSLLFASIDQEGKSSFSIRSEILSGDFKGTFNLFELPGVMKQHINKYFSLQDKKITGFTSPQKFKFDLAIKNTDLLTEIVFPDLQSFTPGKISGAFNSEKDSLEINVSLSDIQYSSTAMDSLVFRVDSDKEQLNYSLRVKQLVLDTVHVDEIGLVGRIEHDSIYTTLRILDSVSTEKYVFGGVIRSQENRFQFHLIPDKVILNYNRWSVPADNYLQFGGSALIANNFSISKDQEKIALITDGKDATIALEFANVQLANLTHIVAGRIPASGILNGDFKVTTREQGNFSSRLEIRDLAFFGKPVGQLTFDVAHSSNTYNLEVNIKGEGTDLKAKGTYVTKRPASEFNIDVALSPLSFQTIEPFSFGHLLKTKGDVSGNLKLTGTLDQPAIRGVLTFKDASFLLRDVNSTFNLQNEKISFNESGIAFDDFTIRDEKNNKAEIKGSILTKAYKDFDFDLRMEADDFQLLNTQPDNERPFYGLVKIDTRTRISGNISQPKVNMTISPSDDTNFTYVIPQTAKTALETEGIIRFRTKKVVNDPFLAGLNLKDTIRSESLLKGIELTANIQLNDKAILNIVIDPLTGDKLSVQGSSTLVFAIDHSGDMNLSGRYEITKGSYDFSFYKLVKRQFIIEPGGSITWSGDVMRAQLDIRASYTVETSPVELVQAQVSAAEATSYKQVLPFLVYLNIKGQLLTPDISFMLDMPDNKKNANGGIFYSRLQDINSRESDLNKQVFALLILKRFIADNPLESQQGGGLANTARQSVSRILSDQLNRLADNIKGVDLSLDVKSSQDYAAATSTQQGQTRVQLGVSKTAFNDRLVIKLSGNVNIEGQDAATSSSASNYIGDLALEYKITEDGRLRITGFRNSNYDIISGELTETGAGLIYIKDYNTLKELFKPNALPKK